MIVLQVTRLQSISRELKIMKEGMPNINPREQLQAELKRVTEQMSEMLRLQDGNLKDEESHRRYEELLRQQSVLASKLAQT